MEGDRIQEISSLKTDISIHSLRMEGDCGERLILGCDGDFNPLPPHGGRQYLKREGADGDIISIHSLRMEGDACKIVIYSTNIYFNPLPPHGGRHHTVSMTSSSAFISIHSLRTEGDRDQMKDKDVISISIHSLRTEGDC